MKLIGKLLAAIGVAIIGYGYWDWRSGTEPKKAAAAVDMAKIEAGEEPVSKYWKVGPYVELRNHTAKMIYAPSIFRSSSNEGPTLALFYPIVSLDHPYLTAKPTIQEVGGDLVSFPAKLKKFSVLVKIDLTPKLPSTDDVWPPKKIDGLQGVVVGRASQLGTAGTEYFNEEYPELDLEHVWILERGSEPSMVPRRLIVFGLGLAAFIAGALLWGDKDDTGSPPPENSSSVVV